MFLYKHNKQNHQLINICQYHEFLFPFIKIYVHFLLDGEVFPVYIWQISIFEPKQIEGLKSYICRVYLQVDVKANVRSFLLEDLKVHKSHPDNYYYI